MFSTKITFVNSDGTRENAEFFTKCPYCFDDEEFAKRKKEWAERLGEVLFIMQELEPCDSRNWTRDLWNKEAAEFNFHNLTKHLVILIKGPFGFQVMVRDI